MRALITGVTGQDGSYLAELLLGKGYEVYGMLRNIRRESHQRLAGIASRIQLVEADLTDQSSLDRVLQPVRPDELYNLAGTTCVLRVSHVATAGFKGKGSEVHEEVRSAKT